MKKRKNRATTPPRAAQENESVSIAEIDKVKYILGGAANTSLNIHRMIDNDKLKVHLFGIVGNDGAASKIRDLLRENGIRNTLFTDESRPTTQKHRRFTPEGVLVDRFDYEKNDDIDGGIADRLARAIMSAATTDDNNLKAIVFCDYNKGVLTSCLCQCLIAFAKMKNIFTFVDPKLHLRKFDGCFCFKPNLKEGRHFTMHSAAAAANHDDEKSIVHALMRELVSTQYVVLTAAANGIYVGKSAAASSSAEIVHICKCDRTATAAVDVTGAGDIVMATIVSIFCGGLKSAQGEGDMEFAAEIADRIARKSVLHVGNFVANADLLHDEILDLFATRDHYLQNILQLNEFRRWEYCVVFTNGCFDLLHAGHLRLLNYCKFQVGTTKKVVVIVGLNSDASVRRLKGAKRPICSCEHRAAVLRELPMVDVVIPFEDDTPLHLVRNIRPDVLVKGGDYNQTNIIGSAYAGETQICEFVSGYSTTNIVSRILHID